MVATLACVDGVMLPGRAVCVAGGSCGGCSATRSAAPSSWRSVADRPAGPGTGAATVAGVVSCSDSFGCCR